MAYGGAQVFSAKVHLLAFLRVSSSYLCQSICKVFSARVVQKAPMVSAVQMELNRPTLCEEVWANRCERASLLDAPLVTGRRQGDQRFVTFERKIHSGPRNLQGLLLYPGNDISKTNGSERRIDTYGCESLRCLDPFTTHST